MCGNLIFLALGSQFPKLLCILDVHNSTFCQHTHGRMATHSSNLIYLCLHSDILSVGGKNNGKLPSWQTPTTSCNISYNCHAVPYTARLIHPTKL